MSLCCWVIVVALIATSSGINPGVKIKLTDKGLEYGRQLGMASIQEKLKTIKIPDMSGKRRVRPIGKVKYNLSNLRILNVGLPKSAVTLVPGAGVRLSISNAFLSMRGNWKVKILRIIKKRGSFALNVNGVTISTTIAIKNDGTGRPAISSTNCAATVSSVKVRFHGGASWLYNLFKKFINRALQKSLQKQMCPLVAKAIANLNPQLKTLNVVAKVDKNAEIEYSLVSSPSVSRSSIELNLKGVFYNIGKHQEPPFSPAAFSLPPQNSNMLYIGMSAFTLNSAGFVYNRAGVLKLDITDNMIPRSSPIRLTTRTLGTFIPEIARRFPGQLVKMVVKTARAPTITFEPNNATVQTFGIVTAYAIQPNGTLAPLFVLNLDTSVSAKVYIRGMTLAGTVTLNKLDLTLGSSNVGSFQVTLLDSILEMVLKLVVIPQLNAKLAQGYPLPAIGRMKLVKTNLMILKNYVLIGTDVQF